MNTKQQLSQTSNKNQNRETPGADSKAEIVNQWWDKLPPAEREFAYELGRIVRGFRERNFADIVGDVSKVKAELRSLMLRLATVYQNAFAQVQIGGPSPFA